MKVTKAIIPAAGLGTRLLPATKAMPKEMLPIIDKPVLQFVIEEAAAAGIEDLLIVTGRGKRAIENHLDYSPGLERHLLESGKADQMELVRGIGDQCRIFFVRQKEQLGLGDAIRIGRRHIAGEPFAVLLGDTIIAPPEGSTDSLEKPWTPGLRQLLDVYEQTQSSVVAVHRVPRAALNRYGVVDGQPVEGRDDLYRLNRLVEKPSPDEAPSDMAIAGRYVFDAEIFGCIDETREGVGGEIQLTDAMNLLAHRKSMYALAWQAKRYDIGNRVEYAKCFIDYALTRHDTAEAIREHLKKVL